MAIVSTPSAAQPALFHTLPGSETALTLRRKRIRQIIDLVKPLSTQFHPATQLQRWEDLFDELAFLAHKRLPTTRNFRLDVSGQSPFLDIQAISPKYDMRLRLNDLAPGGTVIGLADGFYARPCYSQGNADHVDKIGVSYQGLQDVGGVLMFFHEIGHLRTVGTHKLDDFWCKHLAFIRAAKKSAALANDYYYTSKTSAIPHVNYRPYLPSPILGILRGLEAQAEKEAWDWAVDHAQVYEARYNFISEIGEAYDVQQFIEACRLATSRFGTRVDAILF